MNVKDAQIQQIATEIGQEWIDSPYYDEAEKTMDVYWDELIWPFIKDCDFSAVVDLAAGHGRNAHKLKTIADKILVVDINQKNVDFCKKRFKSDKKITCIKNNGISLDAIKDSSITFLYCFDAMVHFDSDVIRKYLREFHRILTPGGKGFCHHSNNTNNPTGDFHDSPGWRNYMSDTLFRHYCYKEGLKMVDQKLVNWTHPESDCFSLFGKQ